MANFTPISTPRLILIQLRRQILCGSKHRRHQHQCRRLCFDQLDENDNLDMGLFHVSGLVQMEIDPEANC